MLFRSGSVAFRMSLFSAVCGAAACGLLFGIARAIGLGRAASAGAALLLAFSPSFWSQANIQRVYTLNALFVVLVTWFAWRWHRKGRLADLAFAFFFFLAFVYLHHGLEQEVPVADAGLEPGEIDVLISATMTPDHYAPGNAPLIQHRMGLGQIAAYELRKLDYDVEVLEARDWVGGLTWTVKRGARHTEMDTGERQVCDFDEGHYINVGAWRIPNSDEGILGYCKELGVPLEIFINASDANFFYEENPDLGPLSGRRVRLREVKADMWGSTTELLVKAMDQGDIDVPISGDDMELLTQYQIGRAHV